MWKFNTTREETTDETVKLQERFSRNKTFLGENGSSEIVESAGV